MTRGAALASLLAIAGPAAGQSIERCVEARVAGEVAYGCLNDSWARLVDRAHTPAATNTLSATSPSQAVATFNRAATAERMGNAFGHSAVSQRVAPPVYAAPLLRPTR